MVKAVIKATINGALIGVAMDFIVSIIISLQLRLGYLMPYPALLPEQVGGEMNAVILQAAVCVLLGGGIGAAWRTMRWKECQVEKRRLFAAIEMIFSMSIIAILMIQIR